MPLSAATAFLASVLPCGLGRTKKRVRMRHSRSITTNNSLSRQTCLINNMEKNKFDPQIWGVIVSRPYITYAVHVLSRFMHQPRKAHMEASLRVVRYLKNTPSQGLFFSLNNVFIMRAYCDSNWVGCPLTRRLTTGYCVFLRPSLIS